MEPIFRPVDPSMFDGVVMNVIEMCPVIRFVAYKVLPETSLPEGAFAVFSTGRAYGIQRILEGLGLFGEAGFDQAPSF